MKKNFILAGLLSFICLVANAQSPLTQVCNSTAYGAGQVTSAGVKTDPGLGTMTVDTAIDDYAVFTLNAIPANATITNVSAVIFVSGSGGGASNNQTNTHITGTSTDLTDSIGIALYDTIKNATLLATGGWGSGGVIGMNHTVQLGAAGIALVQANIGGTFSLGYYVSAGGGVGGNNNPTYNIGGEAGGNPPMIVVTYTLPCNGTPATGTVSPVSANFTTQCGSTQTLTLSGYTGVGGLTYQWETNTGSGFTTAPGATNTTYTATYTAATTTVNCIVTCVASGLSTTSSTSTINVATVAQPYFAVTSGTPYTQGFENAWITVCASGIYTDDAPDMYWMNTPTSGNASWRRDDDGASAGWTVVTLPDNMGASTGSHFARFNTWANPVLGDFDLHLDLSATGTKQLAYDYKKISSNFGAGLGVYLSTNGAAGPFTRIDTAGVSASWSTRTVNITSTGATCIIRFIGTGDITNDIGIDNVSVSVLTPCTGMPVAGTFTASPATGCIAYSSTLSVTTPIAAVGISYQWQSSADGITYTSIAGATGTSYNVNVSANTYYRFYVKCSNSNDSAISAGTELMFVPEVASIATLPYFQGFESWIGSCFTYDRPDANWLNGPTSGNQSWRRDDEGTDANWTNPTSNIYSPVFTQGAHSARFHSTGTPLVGNLDLHINLSNAGTKTMTFDYNNDNGGDYLTVELSENGGSTFTTLGTYQSGTTTGVTGWQRETIGFTSVAANAVIRFAGTGAVGVVTTDIGIDSLNIIADAPCVAVTGLAANGITQTGATINWTTISGTAGYEAVVNTSSANPTGSGTGVTSPTYNATGLIAGTVYYAHVRDSCGPGDFSAWTTITFTTNGTPPPVCDTIASLAVSGITSSSANLTWNVVTGTDGYEYVVSTSPTTPATGTGTVNHNYAATGLSANTIYHVFVRDSCGVGNFSAWDTLSFITKHSTGIASVNNDQFDVNAYPNPATDVVTIRAYGVTSDNRKVSLTDITGRVISTMPMATDKIDFNMSNLAPGIYLVRYEDDAHTRIIKVNKQ